MSDIEARIVQALLVGLFAGVTWLIRAAIQRARDVDQIREHLRHLPTQEAVHDLALAVKGVQGELARLTDRLDEGARRVDRQDRIIERHERWLVERGL